MAVEVASMRAVLDLDKRGLDTGLKSAGSQLSNFGKNIAGGLGLPTDLASATVMGINMISSALTGAIAAARESIAVNKDLEATILSTGGVAGVTGDMARKYAEDLSMVTNFQDDAILSGEAMLLTFTKIGKDVFPLATETMLNMAQKFGSIDTAAIQLGKALNDPVKGVTALRRVGIQFSSLQEQQIKDFMAVNDIAGAQGVILGELGTQFGGLAKAAADPFIQVQNAIGEIQETLGMGLMPMLLAAANEVLPALRNAASDLSPSLGELGIALGKDFGANLAEIIGMVVDLANQFGGMIEAAGKLGAALGMGGEAADGLNIRLLPLKITFGLLGAVFDIVAATLESLAFVLNIVSTGWGLLTGKIDSALGISAAVVPVFDAIGRAGTTLSQIIQIIGMAWMNLIRVMSQPFNPPPLLNPGSPTPMELGLRGIASAIKSIPALPSLGGTGMAGMIPMAAGGGGASNITVNVGSVSASSTTTGDPATEAIRMTVQLLRQQLDR